MERAARLDAVAGSRARSAGSRPYPIVFERGSGASVFDVDGNRYLDMFSNGLSLMHGHAYAPDRRRRCARRCSRGTAWPGASDAQVEFAELLCARIPGAEQVRFTNTGTEATMLARQTRAPRQRPPAGDQGLGRLPRLLRRPRGRACRARARCPGGSRSRTFGELDSYAEALERHAGEVAAIIVEPVQYTGVVTPPPDGFLAELRELARAQACCSSSTTA